MHRTARRILVFGWAVAITSIVCSWILVRTTITSTACIGQDTTADRNVYRTASLELVYPRLGGFRVPSATPASVERQLEQVQDIRNRVPERVADPCMQAWVTTWLDYYEREAQGAVAERQRLGGYSSDFEKERSELVARAVELKKRLGVSPF